MAAPLSQVDLDLILEKTRNLWCEIRDQRIFITGGTGFFGCWLTESFAHANRVLALDARATILTRDPTAFVRKCPHLASDPAITLLPGDVRDFAYPHGDFSHVIHAATESSARQAPQKPLEMTETILRGTERVLEFAATHGARKFLFTSSGAVYGSQPASISHLVEDYAFVPDPLGRASEYAQGQTGSRVDVRCLQQQVRVSNVRLHGASLSWVRIYPWMRTLPSETSFATPCAEFRLR